MSVQILRGDCRDVLKTLPDASVHCCVTSPPYWGLRDYGCDGQIGLEASVAEWVGQMVDVFREVRRVLRDDGTLWLNLGDSYAGSRCGEPSGSLAREGSNRAQSSMTASRRRDNEPIPRSDVRVAGLKPKDLIGQPWRVAFALQDDGWYLRQDIIWAKPNPMPESVRDRCTKAHEYLFLLSKSERYYYDFEAMQEAVNGGAKPRRSNNGVGFGHGFDEKAKPRYVSSDRTPAGWATGTGRRHDELTGNFTQARKLAGKDAGRGEQGLKHSEKFGRGPGWRVKNNESMNEALATMPESRNRRSVWTVPTEPFKEAHFATFPPALIEPCIAAGCPEGGTVLDPFGGAGTTGLVADRLQRSAVLIELNPAYIEIARRRIVGDAPMFAEVA